MDSIETISQVLSEMKASKEIYSLLQELLTKAELNALSKRWQILNLLNQGITQRQISEQLNVSLCNVTRGSKILKKKNSIIKKYLKRGKNKC